MRCELFSVQMSVKSDKERNFIDQIHKKNEPFFVRLTGIIQSIRISVN